MMYAAVFVVPGTEYMPTKLKSFSNLVKIIIFPKIGISLEVLKNCTAKSTAAPTLLNHYAILIDKKI